MNGNIDRVGLNDRLAAGITAGGVIAPQSAIFHGFWRMELYRPNKAGILRLIDEDEWSNKVVYDGLEYALGLALDLTTSPALARKSNWFIGLTDGSPVTVANADSMSSHAGWAEVQTYSEAVRQTWTDGGVAASPPSIDNSASKATFSINGSATVGGAFMCDNNTKGGTSGLLFSAGAFTAGDRSLQNGDSVQVQATFTATSS